jgi:glycosyltransferase involved in cell wall biosynthesis
VPFYDERQVLPRLLAEIDALARRLKSRSIQIEAILVDDGSQDRGAQAVCDWLATGGAAFDLRLLRLSRNYGKELALSAGLEAADGDAVVMMDADLQHPVALIDTFADAWIGEGYDVVYASREQPPAEGLAKRLVRSGFYKLLSASSDAAIDPWGGDFRLMSRRAYEALRRFPERERLMKGLYGLIGFPTKAVPYTPPDRRDGVSKFSALKLWAMGLNGVTAFSVLPLRLTTIMGIALGLLALGYGAWTIVEKMVFGIYVPGYPTLIVLISGVGAAQLIGMGIVGEYLGKVLVEVKRRPLYILESEQRFAATVVPFPATEEFYQSA